MTEAWCSTSTRSLVALRMHSLRCLLGDWLRGEGLGIPSLLLECHSSCLQQEWSWRVRSSSWCWFVEGDMECGWFLLVVGGERGAGESGLQFVVATWEDWILHVAVWRMVLLSAVFLPRLLTSL